MMTIRERLRQDLREWLGIDALHAEIETLREDHARIIARVEELEQDYARNYSRKDEPTKDPEPIVNGFVPHSIRKRRYEVTHQKKETK